ncbi:MAG TPA: DNA-binding protein [Flavobacteriales bacterium]|nr:DNA-binding protein [Flavobacteriales bacterium]
MNITFNELRKIKDNLPDGSIHRIAKELELNVETVWNYFGGYSYANGRPMGVHVEEGPDGGVIALDDTRILDIAHRILNEKPVHA